MSGEPDKVETVVEIDVPPGQEGGVRLDTYLASKLPNTTRSRVQKGIKEGRVDVNGRTVTRVSTGVQPGDALVCRILRPPPIEIVPENLPLDIVYEDDTLIVLDKAPGMVVHPAFGHRSGTLINALLHHVGAGPLAAEDVDDADDEEVGLATAGAGPKYDGDVALRPGLVHRLDKGTSGLMVVAKTDAALSDLGRQFAARTIRREYLALVWGVPDPPAGRIETWLARDPRDRKRVAVSREDVGKWAATNYETVEAFAYTALVRFRLETGRTHQIRIHAKHLGHSVFGDRTYDGDRIRYGSMVGTRKAFVRNLLEALPRQALHARTLGFRHPATGESVFFESPLPPDIAHVVERLRAVEPG